MVLACQNRQQQVAFCGIKHQAVEVAMSGVTEKVLLSQRGKALLLREMTDGTKGMCHRSPWDIGVSRGQAGPRVAIVI